MAATWLVEGFREARMIESVKKGPSWPAPPWPRRRMLMRPLASPAKSFSSAPTRRLTLVQRLVFDPSVSRLVRFSKRELEEKMIFEEKAMKTMIIMMATKAIGFQAFLGFLV